MAEKTPPQLPDPVDDSPGANASSGRLSKRRRFKVYRKVLPFGTVQVDFIRYSSPDLIAVPGKTVWVTVDPADAGYVLVRHGGRLLRCNGVGGQDLNECSRKVVRALRFLNRLKRAPLQSPSAPKPPHSSKGE